MRLVSNAFALFVLITPIAWGGILHPSAIVCDMDGVADSGLVVISADMPDSTLVTAPVRISFVYNRVGATFLSDANIFISRTSPLFKSIPSDFEGLFGRLYVLRLKAGHYEFREWNYVDGLTRKSTPLSIGKISFDVQPERATYLGNFHSDFFIGKSILRQSVGEPWVTVVDYHARDLSVFLRKCPAFDATLIDVRVMNPSEWAPKR